MEIEDDLRRHYEEKFQGLLTAAAATTTQSKTDLKDEGIQIMFDEGNEEDLETQPQMVNTQDLEEFKELN